MKIEYTPSISAGPKGADLAIEEPELTAEFAHTLESLTQIPEVPTKKDPALLADQTV